MSTKGTKGTKGTEKSTKSAGEGRVDPKVQGTRSKVAVKYREGHAGWHAGWHAGTLTTAAGHGVDGGPDAWKNNVGAAAAAAAAAVRLCYCFWLWLLASAAVREIASRVPRRLIATLSALPVTA